MRSSARRIVRASSLSHLLLGAEMAQSMGGFGDHATKVALEEDLLRKAVADFQAASAPESRMAKAKAVKHRIERLRSARLRLFKARLSALNPVYAKHGANSLRNRIAKLQADGLDEIAAEFGAQGAFADQG